MEAKELESDVFGSLGRLGLERNSTARARVKQWAEHEGISMIEAASTSGNNPNLLGQVVLGACVLPDVSNLPANGVVKLDEVNEIVAEDKKLGSAHTRITRALSTAGCYTPGILRRARRLCLALGLVRFGTLPREEQVCILRGKGVHPGSIRA